MRKGVIYIMFESFKEIYFRFKSFINYISCNLVFNNEDLYYQELPEEEIKL